MKSRQTSPVGETHEIIAAAPELPGLVALRFPPILTPPPITRHVIGKKFLVPLLVGLSLGEMDFLRADSGSTSEGLIVAVGDGIAGST